MVKSSGTDASQQAALVDIHAPVAACHSSSDEAEASLAPPAARTGGHWETLLGLNTLPPGISATRVGRVLRDHLANSRLWDLLEASMRERLHHQPRLRAVHVQHIAPKSSSSGAEAALLARAVVTVPGPGLGVLRTRRPTIFPGPGTTKCRSRDAPVNKIAWPRGHGRYFRRQSSMSLEQETFWAADGWTVECAATIRGKVNYRAAMRNIGRLIRLPPGEITSQSSQPACSAKPTPRLLSYRNISLCLSACRSCSRNMRAAPTGNMCALVGRQVGGADVMCINIISTTLAC